MQQEHDVAKAEALKASPAGFKVFLGFPKGFSGSGFLGDLGYTRF